MTILSPRHRERSDAILVCSLRSCLHAFVKYFPPLVCILPPSLYICNIDATYCDHQPLMEHTKQIWYKSILAGMFLLLLAVSVSLRVAHNYEHQGKKTGCTVSAVCAVCEAEYMHTAALPVSFEASFAPHFFELPVLLTRTVNAPAYTFISCDPGRGPPCAA